MQFWDQKEAKGVDEPKNVDLVSVQTTYRPVRACKPPGFMQCHIELRREICVNLRLSIAMVPCLHRSNLHIKRKLCGRRG